MAMRYLTNVMDRYGKLPKTQRDLFYDRAKKRKRYTPYSLYSSSPKTVRFRKDFNRCMDDPTAYKKLMVNIRQIKKMDDLL